MVKKRDVNDQNLVFLNILLVHYSLGLAYTRLICSKILYLSQGSVYSVQTRG